MRHPHGVVAVCAPWNYPVEEIVGLCFPDRGQIVAGMSEARALCGNQPVSLHAIAQTSYGDNVLLPPCRAPEI